MWDSKEQRIDNIILSLNQPHVRPIVRVKRGKIQNLEPKYLQVVWYRYIFLHRISWENYNES